ncbi:MAG TPA: phosphatase PAP2 family protein [Candidatus Thermoplasmatota archaeon]|nr:phosphatase PAP2 family protein [Candidatus Thermoplasmatota archaeon]
MKSARFWATMALAGVVLFLASFALRPLDEPVGRAVAGAPGLVLLAGGLAFLGGVDFVAPALVAGVLTLFILRRWWGAVRLVGSIAVAEAAARGLKLLFARPRPEYMLVETGGFSFPSGHATVGAAFAMLLVWFAGHYVTGRRFVVAVLAFALAWTVSMAASRMVLGVHYLSDVVAGVGVGMACAGGFIGLTLVLQRRFSAPPP